MSCCEPQWVFLIFKSSTVLTQERDRETGRQAGRQTHRERHRERGREREREREEEEVNMIDLFFKEKKTRKFSFVFAVATVRPVNTVVVSNPVLCCTGRVPVPVTLVWLRQCIILIPEASKNY